ncbi:efflux RND transporter periplasmic adaptor subunit [Propionivibrio limicola]|uniref:efflux RND transporter periplasmic adaptor subunit n=1 Tax=Propionivibrio limicola TaxID=167645 RepID=UPI0012923996|nr:efflux RND transporter periplasmic adaptor subunit [Propionivibrio limicola]
MPLSNFPAPIPAKTKRMAILALTLVIVSLLGPARPSSAQPLPRATPLQKQAAVEEASPPARPTTVTGQTPQPITVIKPKVDFWPEQVDAKGNIMPWQESHIGTEVGGLRLLSVLVNVGDIVRKGQVLARLNPATVETELETAKAQFEEAEATLTQAVATLERAKRLMPSGGVSQQEMMRYETQKHTAEARLNAARAQLKKQQLRLDNTTLVANDDGVISASAASEGAIVQSGSELFRLIRQGRLEWRAEVDGETLLKLSPGQEVTVKSPLGTDVKGRVRQASPAVDLTTRTGLAYVDLPTEAHLKAGLRVSGTLTVGKRRVLSVPATAVQRQEGGARVFKVGEDNKIDAVDVKTGRVNDDWIEITAGLDENTPIVANSASLQKDAPAKAVQPPRQPEPKKAVLLNTGAST